MGKVKKSSYKKKWGGDGEGGEVPAAPAVVANAEPAPAMAKPSIFENLNPSAAVAGVTGALSSVKDKAAGVIAGPIAGLENKLGEVNQKVEGLTGIVEGKVGSAKAFFQGKIDAVTGAAVAPVGQDPIKGGKRRRTRKRTAKRKSHKRKKTHKRKKSHKRRK
jgi:hypothetical protein